MTTTTREGWTPTEAKRQQPCGEQTLCLRHQEIARIRVVRCAYGDRRYYSVPLDWLDEYGRVFPCHGELSPAAQQAIHSALRRMPGVLSGARLVSYVPEVSIVIVEEFFSIGD